MAETEPENTENGGSGDKLTPEKANKLYNQKGMTQAQIAEKFDVSQPYVSQTLGAYNKGKEQGKEKGRKEALNEVKENPEEFDLTSNIEDEPDEQNPYDYHCHSCGEEVAKGDGKEPCPECGTVLDWSQV